jgi:hypothetical protein
MSKKYISLEHAIRNAVRDQQYKKKPINEDFEFEMARNELRTAIDAAKRLMTHLDGEGELEAWVQSKITKGADYLDTVADYMDSRDTKKLKEETEEIMEALGIVGGVFKGNQFQGGVPEIGPGHTKAALRTSSNRKAVKQQKSLTMHGKVAESIIDFIPAAIKAATKVASKGASEIEFAASKGGQLVTTGAKGAAKAEPEVAKAATKVKVKEPEAPTKPLDIPELPEPKLPATVPAQPKPSTPENLPSVPKTTTKPSTKTETETKPETKVEPKTETETKTDTKMDNKPPVVPPETPAKTGAGPRIIPPIPSFGMGDSSIPNYNWAKSHENPWVVHRASARISFNKEEVERKEIEAVARKDEKKDRKNVGRDGESQLTRQASILQNRVDEEKKMAGVIKSIVKKKKEEKEGGPNPLVDFHPQLNHKLDNQS